ncbi:hypothetical protein TIFTF001_046766 [Ficus carica]|uniref:Uncharacterized protein n=1 Tax=Ficus carica TaxID=3494 RepID=A0AA87ZIL9_FICCA|nr:hypothetical protein TIFTF001_046766 [Ficus carica]
MTVGHMIDNIMEAEIVAHAIQADVIVGDHQAPVDDAGIGEPIYEPGPDIYDFIVAPVDQPEDPPVINIPIDDEEHEPEQEDEEDQELQHAGWLEEEKDFEDDPEEMLFHDGDWEADSDASSVVTDEFID